MNILRGIFYVLPGVYINKAKTFLEARALRKLSRLGFKTQNLLHEQQVKISEIFGSQLINSEWEVASKNLAKISFPDSTGGVNAGDRKAIFFLIRYFHPKSVLEIGTHIGASTIHIASALAAGQENKVGDAPKLTTVDLVDVNDADKKPWLKYEAEYSPHLCVEELGLTRLVNFRTEKSEEFMRASENKYDFIFLDGSHAASAVYLEISLALNLLNKGGVILLHDYFPNLKPLWSNGLCIPGPYLAIERIKDEGCSAQVLPLADLPWHTKLESHTTSLALLLRGDGN